MTTTTVNANSTNWSYISSSSSVYSTARTGSSLFSNIGASVVVAGQQKSGSNYFCYLTYLEFDTSAIPVGATINSVTLKLAVTTDNSTQDLTLQARSFDFGTAVDVGDWRGSSFATDTLLATKSTAGISTGSYVSFAENGTAFRSGIVAGGNTRIVVGSDRFASGTTPTTQEFVQITPPSDASLPPQLVVDYTATLTHTLTPTSITSAESFGTAVLTPGGVSLSPTSTTSAEAFGATAIKGVYSLTPSSVASAESFGVAVFVGTITQDDFNDNSIDTSKWTAWDTGASVAETNHTLVVTPAASAAQYGGLNSNNRFSLIGKRASVQLLQELNAGSSETDLWLYLDDNNKVGIQVTGTVIQAYKDVAGTESWTDALTYDSAVHRYLGFSESGGTLVWEYSTDGAAWTTIRSESAPFSVTSLEYRIFAGTWDASNANPGAAIFDNVNLLPTYLTPTSIASGESFGLTTLILGANLTPTHIQSGEAFGTAVLTTLATLLPSKIDSGEVFGVAEITAGAIHLHPTSIASAETFGTAVLDTAFRINPAHITSAELFNAARINTSVSLFPVSIASGESFGVAKFGFRIHIRHGVDMWVFVKEPTLLMNLWLMEEDE